MFHTKQAQKITFFIGARRRIDGRAPPLRNLDCCDSDTASRTVNQYRLSGLKLRQVEERIINSEKGARNRRGRFKRQVSRNMRQRNRFCNHAIGEARRAKAHYAITG